MTPPTPQPHQPGRRCRPSASPRIARYPSTRAPRAARSVPTAAATAAAGGRARVRTHSCPQQAQDGPVARRRHRVAPAPVAAPATTAAPLARARPASPSRPQPSGPSVTTTAAPPRPPARASPPASTFSQRSADGSSFGAASRDRWPARALPQRLAVRAHATRSTRPRSASASIPPAARRAAAGRPRPRRRPRLLRLTHGFHQLRPSLTSAAPGGRRSPVAATVKVAHHHRLNAPVAPSSRSDYLPPRPQ